MSKITFGPYFCAAYTSPFSDAEVVPLGLRLEWASATRAVRIPLFRRPADPGQDSLRLEHLLFARRGLPLSLECSAFQVVETSKATFLPLEALLAALYQRHEVGRSIFQVLAELSSVVFINSRVGHAMLREGALVPRAEAAGFRLNRVVRDGAQTYAEIVWRPAGQGNRFHACICRFQMDPGGLLDEGEWLPPAVIGVASLLASEFHNLVPGPPKAVFSLLVGSLLK